VPDRLETCDRPISSTKRVASTGAIDAEFHRNTDVSIIHMRINPSLIHLPLAVPPSLSGRLFSFLLLSLLFVAGCGSTKPKLPYPAYVQTDELPDIFMAGLPGVRAKQLAGDPQLRTTSNRIDLPSSWAGTSGGSPGKALEIFVVAGDMTIADIALQPGGYAYLPPGSLGFNLKTRDGARILYFLDDVDPLNVIRSPIIIDSGLLDWEPTSVEYVATKDLRADPGSGARTWLLRIEPGASLPWESSTAIREGYMLAGQYQHSECYEGEPATWPYTPGGYMYRPGGVLNGGPEAVATTETIWLLREKVASRSQTYDVCR